MGNNHFDIWAFCMLPHFDRPQAKLLLMVLREWICDHRCTKKGNVYLNLVPQEVELDAKTNELRCFCLTLLTNFFREKNSKETGRRKREVMKGRRSSQYAVPGRALRSWACAEAKWDRLVGANSKSHRWEIQAQSCS